MLKSQARQTLKSLKLHPVSVLNIFLHFCMLFITIIMISYP